MRRFTAGLLLLLLLSPGLACRRRVPPPAPPLPERVTLLAVGDLLMHQDVKRSAEEAPGGFMELWGGLVPRFRAADVVLGNLETPIAPRTGRPGIPFVFNAPSALAPALKESGFHLLSTANNHTFDQGPRGLLETLEHLEGVGLQPLGSGRNRAEAEAPRVLTRQGIRMGFLGRTDLFNVDLNRKPEGPWVAALDPDLLESQIRNLRSRVDAVVLVLHWGNEYQTQPSGRQRDLAAKFVAAGADLIIGHHPHVLQPVAWVEAGGRRGAVAYSLGNFISNQDRFYQWRSDPAPAGDNRDGALLEVVLLRLPGAPLRLESVRVQPLWTENAPPAYPRGRSIRVRHLDDPVLEPGLRDRRLARAAKVLGLQPRELCLR